MYKLFAFVFLFLSATLSYAQKASFSIPVSVEDIQSLQDPKFFVSRIYKLLLFDGDNKRRQEIYPSLFFTDSLLNKYKKVVALDTKNKEVGCLNDFDNFTGGQEETIGYWVGQFEKKGNEYLVPVFFDYGGENFDSKKPDIVLHLVTENNRLKINDIEYKNPGNSLRSLMASCLQ